MADTCIRCHLVHANSTAPAATRQELPAMALAIECIEAQKLAMRNLLRLIGKQVACGGCGASMYFVVHNNGKRVPYTEAGLNHFIDCPQRDQFARPKT